MLYCNSSFLIVILLLLDLLMSDPSQAPKLFSDDTVSSHEHDDQVMDDFSDTVSNLQYYHFYANLCKLYFK